MLQINIASRIYVLQTGIAMSQRSQLNHNGIGRTRGAIGVTAQPNLFRNQLTRRPTASSNPSAETARLDVEVLDTSEIVVRNQLGEIQIDDPPTPVLEDTDGQAEDREEIESTKSDVISTIHHFDVF